MGLGHNYWGKKTIRAKTRQKNKQKNKTNTNNMQFTNFVRAQNKDRERGTLRPGISFHINGSLSNFCLHYQ